MINIFAEDIKGITDEKNIKNKAMDASTLFQNGSVWLRADFHLHTKADKEFTYNGDENDFVDAYVNKLVEQKIRVGVITNHNKFDKGEFVSLKKKASEQGIGLFPGVEFSLKEGIHILIVFDDTWYKGHTDNINEFLRTAFYGIPNCNTPPYPNSACGLKEVVEKLDTIGHNYFIIPAHVDANNGLCQVLQGRTIEAFVKHESFEKVLALQKSGNRENYDKICNASQRLLACVEGSDSAHEGIEGIGKGRVTYLKIGDFNFEAIQYALTDFKNRVSAKEQPAVRNSYIKSISFQGGLLNGKEISFSSELNSLIGIRGSGKSSVLEILRYALNIPFGSQAVDIEYKNKLIEHVLKSGGKISVEIVNRHGEIYKVDRIYGQKEDIYKNDVLQSGITLDAILRQPIYFGQKDLSNKNPDFENDLVNKLIGSKLNDIKRKIETQKQEIQKIINDWKGLSNLSTLKKETEIAKGNAEHKMQLFKEKGVTEKLKLQTSFDADITKLKNYHSGITNYIQELVSIIQSHEYLITQDFASETNPAFFAEATQLRNLLKDEFDKLKSIVIASQKISLDFQEVQHKVVSKKEELKEEFAQIKREINIPELNPDDFIKINRELEISKLKLIEIEKSENKRKELETQLSVELNKLDQLWHEEFITLQQEVDKVNKTDDKLSIELEYKGQKDKFLNRLQDELKGSGIRSASCESIVSEYADFIDMSKDNFRKLSNILNENQYNDFKSRFSKNLFSLLTFKVENKFTINFEGKPLNKHSLGQRASALILFLLAQKENDILIIDQPEDDLDNQTIYEDVIREVKKLKGDMQFIFATHNANIPVLGDSEMMVAFQYIDGKEIALEKGSIDFPIIQEKVIRIMEGGKEAFKIRKDIYKIWEVSL